MKKAYISPATSELLMEVQDMMALSLLEDATANKDSEVLVKENNWDFWGTEDVTEE